MPAEMTHYKLSFIWDSREGGWFVPKVFSRLQDGLIYRERFGVGFRVLDSPGTAGAGSCSLGTLGAPGLGHGFSLSPKGWGAILLFDDLLEDLSVF